MGRIKTTFVKNIGKELLEKYSAAFDGSFEHNKTALIPYVSFTSHKMRNLVAGYITSMKNVKVRPFFGRNFAEDKKKDDRFGRRGRRRTNNRR